MPKPFHRVTDRRAIIDRRDVAERLAAGPAERGAAVEVLRDALGEGRAELKRRLMAAPHRGLELANAHAFLTDQIVRLVYDFAALRLYPSGSPSAAERLALCALGGYGRTEMAPFSDVDILFLIPGKLTGWGEQMIESILYSLWDLGLKVGHATRSIDELVRMSQEDVTIRTAMLEARFLWGDRAIFEEASAEFRRQVTAGTDRDFTQQKLAERDARHKRMGDSRYVVEPNVKEGKGGLRDLHTLFWIGKYVHRVERAAELVDAGLLTPREYRQFNKAETFLWAVRINMHDIAGRGEDRLTFDLQRDLAKRLNYRDRAGMSAVERFMRHYFLIARQVGDLTGVFLAHLEERFAESRFRLPSLTRSPKKLDGFTTQRGRIGVPDDDFFREDPVRLIQMFALADRYELEIHPLAMRQASRDAKLIDGAVRRDPRANKLFMDVLTSPRAPDTVLRWMNEAGVFGQFVPDFGRVVARMQYDMYHHYTVDEHTIRAIGLAARIEQGTLRGEHPLSTAIVRQIASRRALYVAVLLHDIAKGRGGDHSELGAEVAKRLCPRFGLSPAETETVAWLVKYHLLMSATAFKRDLLDPKTIQDFVAIVQSADRLRLLLVLTVVDIRAVGPGTWSEWKAQLLRDLYNAAEELIRLGHQQHGREERIAAQQAELAETLGWPKRRFAAYAKRFFDSYWIAETHASLLANARQIEETEGTLSVATTVDETLGATQISIYAPDNAGLFYRIAGGISLCGANILDARVHTTRDGMALDNLIVQGALGQPLDESAALERLRKTVISAISGEIRLGEKLAERRMARHRADVFTVEPDVLIDNRASNRYTVVEVHALDRPALLYGLTRTFFDAKLTIRSAHVATYGERAVDVFYLTDLDGGKIESAARLRTLRKRLLAVAAEGTPSKLAA
jgi:[protein-PII] uridylyltransferase